MHTTVFLQRVVGANGALLPTGVSESLPKYIDVTEKEEAPRKYPLGKAGNLWERGKRENALEKKKVPERVNIRKRNGMRTEKIGRQMSGESICKHTRGQHSWPTIICKAMVLKLIASFCISFVVFYGFFVYNKEFVGWKMNHDLSIMKIIVN